MCPWSGPIVSPHTVMYRCDFIQVCTSGSLVVDFSLEEKPRIISWYFHIKDHTEYVPRSAVGQGVSFLVLTIISEPCPWICRPLPDVQEESGIMGNITCRGILPFTQKLLLVITQHLSVDNFHLHNFIPFEHTHAHTHHFRKRACWRTQVIMNRLLLL